MTAPGERSKRLAAALPIEPASWAIARQLIDVRGVYHVPGCALLGSGGKWLSMPFADLPPNAGLCATCIAPGLDDSEHEFVEWRTLYQPLYLAAADIRPVVQVTYPGQRGSLDRVVDTTLTHDEAYARRRSATALNELFLGYTLVTATAYTLEHRVVSLRSWDHGKTWIEPPSDDWAPPRRRGLVFDTLDSPVYTLVLHGVGRTAPMRAVDLGAPSDFYLLSTLRNGPWAPESGEARGQYGEDWQPE